MDSKTSAEAQEFVRRIISSPIVDEGLCRDHLGAGRNDLDAAQLYLRIPVRARPRLSHFFDPHYYIATNPDIAAAGVDPFIHFVQYGCAESRSPHPLIDMTFMRTLDQYLFSKNPSINQLHEALTLNLVDPSPYFSLDYYRTQAPAALDSDCGLLSHFLSEGLLAGLRPNPFFDPIWYCRQLEGANDAPSGLRHFVMVGDRQSIAPSAQFSGALYLERNPDVAVAGTPPLSHYLTAGVHEGRSCFPVSVAFSSDALSKPFAADDPLTWPERYAAFKTRISGRRQELKDGVTVSPLKILDYGDLGRSVSALALPRFPAPRVCVLIPAYNEAKYTAECIGAILASAPAVTYEVVIADDGSPDASAQSLANIPNVRFVRQAANLGFLRNCNASFRFCKSEYLLLLNNDAQLRPHALDRLVAILDGNPDVAAVGPKILYPNGRLQEAGCSVNRDGTSLMAGLFADPSDPAFNYDREVHYCSGAALLVRTSEIGDWLFDESFAPAYCEDLDLCLRLSAKGRKIIYCSSAEVVHHLSVSTNKQSVQKRLQLVARNQQKLCEKWSGMLDKMNVVRPIAFYLPQYHPTAENNLYWGQGFTEWTNVTKATPAYVGHYQPHLPSDLGFYDLRVKTVLQQQSALARQYGIAGFCVYYYNFGGRRALDEAFEAIVSDTSIDFPYCVCWANESWTRHWDGGSREIIFKQEYDAPAILHVIQDATRFAADPRYIRVNGKPLFLVYRPLQLPDVRKFCAQCREAFRLAGFDGVYLVYVESMEAAETRPRPSDLGFDACVEFPPQGTAVRATNGADDILKEGFIGTRYDFEATVVECISRRSVDYKRHAAVFPSWDNTPRQPLKGDSFIKSTPEAFQLYVEEKLDEVVQKFVGDERLLFVNAWNEWAEGTHLEPDRLFGHRWLEALRNALLTKALA